MKTKLKTLALCAFALVLMNCSGSDDSGSTGSGNKIVGVWKYAGYYDAAEDEFYEDDFGECYVELVDFNSDGSGTWSEDDCGDSQWEMDFEWEKGTGNTYLLTGMDGDTEIIMVEFKNNNNRIYVQDDEDGSSDVYDRQ